MPKEKYVYTGQTNLEVMQNAVNYNKYLYNLVKKEIDALGKKNVKILDFGAGIGTYADIFKNEGIIVDCVEIDPNGVKVLSKKGYKVYESVDAIQDKYDIVYSFNVLEHVEGDASLLKDMSRAVKKQGSIVVYVPAFNAIFSKLDVLVEHLRRYRKQDMKALANKNSLKISKLHYCDPVGFMLAFIYKFIGGSGNLSSWSVWVFDRILFPVSVALEFITKPYFGKNVLAVYKK